MEIDLQSPSEAEDDFLAELKSQFEKEIDIRKTLDNKANTMITVTSGISTLLIAIGTFLISRIVDKNMYYGISIGILTIGLVLAIIGIWFFIRSYSVRRYKYAIGTEYFFDESTGEYKKDHVEKIRNLSKKEFKSRLIKGYLESIKRSAELNLQKGNAIKTGQKFMTFTIISVAILVACVLALMGAGTIKLA
jgi:tetrahydromethanopterin S-methyltransferase subunit B